jgi:hypothetical protein
MPPSQGLISEFEVLIGRSGTLLSFSPCSNFHRSTFYTSENLTFSSICPYQKDYRALPGDLHSHKFISVYPDNSKQCLSLLPHFLVISLSLSLSLWSSCFDFKGLNQVASPCFRSRIVPTANRMISSTKQGTITAPPMRKLGWLGLYAVSHAMVLVMEDMEMRPEWIRPTSAHNFNKNKFPRCTLNYVSLSVFLRYVAP